MTRHPSVLWVGQTVDPVTGLYPPNPYTCYLDYPEFVDWCLNVSRETFNAGFNGRRVRPLTGAPATGVHGLWLTYLEERVAEPLDAEFDAFVDGYEYVDPPEFVGVPDPTFPWMTEAEIDAYYAANP